jgi:hypothetical protein
MENIAWGISVEVETALGDRPGIHQEDSEDTGARTALAWQQAKDAK